MSESGINKVYSNLLMPRFASRAAYNDHVLDFLHGLMITQQQPNRVSNPLRSNAWTLLCRRNESKSPIEPLFNRRLVNCSAHIFDFLHGFIRRSNKAKAYRISSGFILRILITSRLHCICKDVTPYLLSLLKCHCHWKKQGFRQTKSFSSQPVFQWCPLMERFSIRDIHRFPALYDRCRSYARAWKRNSACNDSNNNCCSAGTYSEHFLVDSLPSRHAFSSQPLLACSWSRYDHYDEL